MRIPHATALLAATAIAACSSQDSQAKGASALKAAMKAIEEDWKAVEGAIDHLKKGTAPDLAATEAAARRVAQAMHFAYDLFEDKEVPNFAVMAKEAEAALNAFADHAKSGKQDAMKELGKTLQEQHCARCHDATEEAKG